MAQVILSSVGGQIGGPIGQMIGSAVGAQIDRAAIQSLTPPRQIGPRLDQLRVQGAAEGAPIPAAFGRVRVVGQVIWAARFREQRTTGRAGKGGPRTVDYGYSLSFAVGLCEGPIDGIGRVWADGQPLDASRIAMRLHRGTEDQAPDALVEAVEGEAPAYRGLAYVVFEDLSLEAFGDRVPQLAFEVFRRPRGETPRLEDKLEGVCLIPGSGEFVYATTPVLRREGLFGARAENVNNRDGRADLMVSLAQLQAQLPNLKRVTLVVSWFGDDLRCGHCSVRPRVDRADKATMGGTWRVAGLERADAEVVSDADGAPAYGGTPSDASVIAAIEELKRRGLEVSLAPFLMMDVPAGNGLDDPYGQAEQAAYPWRGRVTCHPAPGQAGTVDVTSAADDQVATFFGAAQAEDFGTAGDEVAYGGPPEWSWRRMVLHYATLAAMAGADGLLIGSEFRGLTTIRGASGYPAVDALRALAVDCRSILGPDVLLSYAADWSEWSGVQHPDDPGGFVFHLDPLWADPAISCVGIDWYPPISDWRDGDEHADALEGCSSAHDGAYLRDRVQGGEAFHWYYSDAEARDDQTRTPITDGLHDEPWVFRTKDVAGWWANPHHDRPCGERSESSTAWQAGMKPVRLFEFGCGAVDRGGNAPNLFVDPKSAESAVPPFSDGRRDDLMQRRLLEATLDVFAGEAANPAAVAYEGRMLEALDAWCWDARPFPDFPARPDVWSDAANWSTGHWLNGRLTGEAADLMRAIGVRAGLADDEIDVSQVHGAIDGYLIDRPMTGAAALAPLVAALGLKAVERDEGVGFLGPDVTIDLEASDLALPDDGVGMTVARTLAEPVAVLRLRFIDGEGDYATGAVVVRSETYSGAAGLDVDLPMVVGQPQAETTARSLLDQHHAAADQRTVRLAPLAALRLEAGDVVRLPASEGVWRVQRIDLDEGPAAILEPAPQGVSPGALESWRPGDPLEPDAPAWFLPLDLPGDAAGGEGPVIAVAGDPWREVDVHVGPSADSLTWRGRVVSRASAGVLTEPLAPGPCDRWDEAGRMILRWDGAPPESRSAEAVSSGAGTLIAIAPGDDPEIIQYREAALSLSGEWTLSGLLRGRFGTERRAASETPTGAWVIALDSPLARVAMSSEERGLPLVWRTTPAGIPAGGAAMSEAAFTWRGLHLRPWSPAHLSVERLDGGDLAVRWVRRARLGGDGWDLEPPLGEAREVYRVEILDGDAVVLTHEVTEAAFVWTVEDQSAAFPGGLPEALTLRVSQGSEVFGWGEPAQITL